MVGNHMLRVKCQKASEYDQVLPQLYATVYTTTPRGGHTYHWESPHHRLEDLKVRRRSPDLLSNVKIGQGQLQIIMEKILFTIWGLQPFWSSDLNNLMNNLSNSQVISEKKMFRWVCGSPNEWPWKKGHKSA